MCYFCPLFFRVCNLKNETRFIYLQVENESAVEGDDMDFNINGSDFSILASSSKLSTSTEDVGSGSYRRKKATKSKDTLQKETLLSNAMNILGSPTDSHQIFGDYVADQMRNMTVDKQKRLKLLIQKAIIQVEEEFEPTEMQMYEPPFEVVLSTPPSPEFYEDLEVIDEI